MAWSLKNPVVTGRVTVTDQSTGRVTPVEVPEKDVRKLWTDYLARRRAASAEFQRVRFAERVAAGELPATSGTLTLAQLGVRYGKVAG